MAVRFIVKHPDPVLREKAKEVTKFNANLHKLLDDMAETMYASNGVGLAAPQIGILKRVVVVDTGEGLIELVNPTIVEKKGEQIGAEGCLSIPNLVGEVRRAQSVKVKAQNRHGEPVAYDGADFLARAFQHEVDHLNGVLYIDIAERVFAPEEQSEE
ncbi:peptide deformylase [Numidum massiliense]|uniref:peptide deformylase n=1 Tax=Numidum massiliense TaxID=1522315 RepID=UPI0006D541D6|nr:peptide deformylase [Numidum massiliense]